VSHTAKHGRAQASALYQSAYYLAPARAARSAQSPSTAGWPATVLLGILAVLGVVSVTLYGSHAPAPSAAPTACTWHPPATDLRFPS